jgi:uncharacterized protein YbaP (TraB family)
MHIIPDSAFYFPSKLQKVIKHSDKIVLEIGDMNMMKAQQLMTLKEGSCFDIFTPEQKDSVLNWGAKTMNIAPELFEQAVSKSKPFVLMQLGAQDLMAGDVKYVEEEVKKVDKEIPVVGLETLEQQIGLFDSIPDEMMAEMIMSYVRGSENTEDLMTPMIRAYMDKDLEKLAALIAQEESAGGFDSELLLTSRNKAWVPQIEQLISKESCFIAVGAGHLGGKNGVIDLLTKEGYKIVPVAY